MSRLTPCQFAISLQQTGVITRCWETEKTLHPRGQKMDKMTNTLLTEMFEEYWKTGGVLYSRNCAEQAFQAGFMKAMKLAREYLGTDSKSFAPTTAGKKGDPMNRYEFRGRRKRH